MKILAFSTENPLIRKILKYLDLCQEAVSRDPPAQANFSDEIVWVPIEDAGWAYPNQSDLQVSGSRPHPHFVQSNLGEWPLAARAHENQIPILSYHLMGLNVFGIRC